MQGLQGLRIALLIDFDNVILGVEDPPGFDVELVVNALRSRGVVVLGRAYGDWYRHNRHRRKLMEQGIELVETPVFGPLIKNSADIRIVLDAFEIAMLQTHIEAFCLVSGDSDFLPLIKKLQYLGKQVIVIAGNKFTSELVRRNCNEYVSYENLLAESVGAMEDASVLEGAFHLLQRAIHTLHERGMEVRSSTVKQMMLQLNPAFSERTFGCNQFKQFLDKACRASIVTLGDRDRVSGEYLVILAADEVDETPTPVVAAIAASVPATNGAARPERRPRRPIRSPRAAAPAAGEPAAGESAPVEIMPSVAAAGGTLPGSTPAEDTAPPLDEVEAETVPSIPLSARPGLRRGRLRFSGRSFRGNQGQPATAEPSEAGLEPADTAAPQAESTPETGSPVEAATTSLPGITGSEPTALDAAELSAAAEVPGLAAQAIPATEEPAMATPEAPAKPAKGRSTRGGRRRKTVVPETGSTPDQSAATTAPVEDSAPAPESVHPAVATLEITAAEGSTAPAEEPAVTADEAASEVAKKPARRRRSPRKPQS
ncbi:MAG TPA: NYN domain-containing protein [Abditibacteriaceae bacterium]|nr:NYN domain-containing protein [Abditibacteriaceae bacterium]